MKKRLYSQGNGWLLYINKSFCELVGINNNNHTIAITTKNNQLFIRPINIVNKETHNSYIKKELIIRGSAYGLYLSKALLGILKVNPEIDIIDIEINKSALRIKKAE